MDEVLASGCAKAPADGESKVPPLPEEGGQGEAAKPFLLESRDGLCYATILKSFSCNDFIDLIHLLPPKSTDQPRCITFNFTCCDALNGGSAPGFVDVIADLLGKNRQVKIICHTRDYTMFFRNETCLKGVEFELVKKQGII